MSEKFRLSKEREIQLNQTVNRYMKMKIKRIINRIIPIKKLKL